MSAWKEWQNAIKAGDTARAEESRMEYEIECRIEAEYDEREELEDDE